MYFKTEKKKKISNTGKNFQLYLTKLFKRKKIIFQIYLLKC